MKCKFLPDSFGNMKCAHCDYIVHRDSVTKTNIQDGSKLHRRCPAQVGKERRDHLSTTDFPTLSQQAVNYLLDTSAYLKSGMEHVSREDHQQRISVCQSCEWMVIRNGNMRCRHRKCGCVLEKKAWRKSSKCPLGKWS